MSLPKIKLFGVRVALKQIDEEVTGSLFIPSIVKQGALYELGKVWAVGPDATFASEGDTVVFQMPDMVKKSTTYRMSTDGERFTVIHHLDVLAILHKPIMAIEHFEIAGNWVLAEMIVNKPAGGLELPENYRTELEDIRIRIVQLGRGVTDVEYAVGQEIVCEKTRCNPINLEKTDFATGEKVNAEYVFLTKDYVYGVIGAE